MIRPLINAELARPFLADVHLVVGGKGQQCEAGKSAARPMTGGFPPRPDGRSLSATIPLFFIGRNGRGVWLAREAEGRVGGLFLFKRSALRFAAKNDDAGGCATMSLGQRLELDVENRGSPFAAALDFAMCKLAPRMAKPLAAWRRRRWLV